MTVRKSYFYSKIFALVEDIAIFLSVAAEEALPADGSGHL